MKYVSIIESYYRDLTKSEKKVADYVLKVGEEIIYQSIQEVTSGSGVGDATVIRFCQKIGFDGFQAFKLEIAKEDSGQKELNILSYVDSIAVNFKVAVEKTEQLLDRTELERCLKLIEGAAKVIIIGVGYSGFAALELHAGLSRLGRYSKAVLDPHFQALEVALLEEGDILIAFSLSGRTKDVYESCEIAKKAGAGIVAITNYRLSPIALQADIVLNTAMRESLMEGGSMSAKISQLYIVDLLTTGYALMDRERSSLLKEKTARAIIKKSID